MEGKLVMPRNNTLNDDHEHPYVKNGYTEDLKCLDNLCGDIKEIKQNNTSLLSYLVHPNYKEIEYVVVAKSKKPEKDGVKIKFGEGIKPTAIQIWPLKPAGYKVHVLAEVTDTSKNDHVENHVLPPNDPPNGPD